VGSIGLDDIETPIEKKTEVLGGSASYACATGSLFCPTGMVGIVGTDFPRRCTAQFRRFNIDLRGLQVAEGKTFRWSGVYENNMDSRRTLKTELNVFSGFRPDLPDTYRDAPFVFLANISPDLQLHVLDQMRRVRFVAADTMDLWIDTAHDDLLRVLARIDLLLVNETEAIKLTGQRGFRAAARRLMAMGPSRVVIKRGVSGSLLFSRDQVAMAPAYPVELARDPTGAGDSFAGGFMGYLAAQGRVTDAVLRRAQLIGNVVASFGVESFGLEGYRRLKPEALDRRLNEFQSMCRLG